MTTNTIAIRRTATGFFIVGALVFIVGAYVGLVFWENTLGFGAESIVSIDLYVWVLMLSILLVLVLVGLLVLYFLPTSTAPREEEEMEVPVYDEPPAPLEAEADAILAEPGLPLDAQEEALVVRCSNCSHEFELPYSTERPIHGVCPNCGEEAVLEEGEETLAAGGDPVIEIEGIGPVFAEKLQRVGVHTTEQLRAADPKRLADQTGILLTNIETWQAMCDLYRVKGIGKQFAELLARSGIRGAADLAKSTPKLVATQVKAYLGTLEAPPTKGRVDAQRAKRWIAAARRVERA